MSAATRAIRIAAAVLLTGLLAVAAQSLVGISHQTADLRETDELRRVLLATQALIVDAETGQRGYLVARDRRFLEPYQRAVELWHQDFERLEGLSRDEPALHREVQALEPAIQRKLFELKRTLEARDAGADLTTLDEHMLSGKAAMDNIRRLVEALDAHIDALSRQREAQLHARWRKAVALMLVAGFAFLGSLGFVYLQWRTARSRQEMAEERARTARFADEFISMLGHELRNPLNAISTSAQLLQRQGGDNPKLDRIVASTRRIATMVDQLLDLTRSRLGGGIPLDLKEGDLRAIIASIVDEVRAAHPQRTIRLSAPGPVPGLWDGDRLGQVAANLIANAVQHGDPAAPIDVELVADAGEVRFKVHNAGAPIQPELLPRLFEAYKAAPARSPRRSGLGLGLFITQQITRAHGGQIEVRSSGDGTSFTVKLPLLTTSP